MQNKNFTRNSHCRHLTYKVGFTKEGRFSALDIQMWSNAGCSMDLSMLIMSMAMLHMGNCYQFSNFKIRGRLCKTHSPSNTGLSQKTLLLKTVKFFIY
jgi:xanthine dehydrogenase molybdopterin-binding subunit B